MLIIDCSIMAYSFIVSNASFIIFLMFCVMYLVCVVVCCLVMLFMSCWVSKVLIKFIVVMDNV